MKTQYTSGTKVSSLWLNTINGRQLRFIHPPNTPINVMNDGEYWQLTVSDINIGDFDGRYVTVGTTQSITGQKTFNQNVFCLGTATDPNHLIKLNDLNNLTASLPLNYVTVGTTQSITGQKTFNQNVFCLGTATDPNHLIKLNDLNNLTASLPINYVTVGTTQNINGQKTFTGGLRTTVVPTDSSDTIPLGFLNSTISNYVTLNTPQTVTSNKTFSGAIHVREPQSGTEACNLRDSHNRFQQTAKVQIIISPSVITQSVSHQIFDIFNPSFCTISYNKAAIMSGLVLQPHGTLGVFSIENRYGESFDDPTIFVKFDSSLVGGSGYVYLSYVGDLDETINNTATNGIERDNDDLIRRSIRGDIRTVLSGSINGFPSNITPYRAFSFVQMLESPPNVYNPRSGQFNIGGAKEIILSF